VKLLWEPGHLAGLEGEVPAEILGPLLETAELLAGGLGGDERRCFDLGYGTAMPESAADLTARVAVGGREEPAPFGPESDLRGGEWPEVCARAGGWAFWVVCEAPQGGFGYLLNYEAGWVPEGIRRLVESWAPQNFNED
jgi:hypothetical protein